MQRRMRKISTQIFLAQLAILTASMAIGFGLFATTARAQIDGEFQRRVAAIGQTVAAMPDVRACMADNTTACDTSLQDAANEVMRQTGASYVVLIDRNRVRHTHPDPALIGQKIEEPLVAADGQVHLGVDNGATGVTANARVPLRGPDGTIVGEVSVGLQESSVSSELIARLPQYGVWFALALGVGAIAAWLLARRMKRRTFGLELDEIAQLLQEREATLHGIREGVVGIGPDGRISVINDEAQRLLHVPPVTGRRLEDVIPEGPLRDALTDPTSGKDEIVLTDDRWLVVNRMPVILSGASHGVVVTLRDRTDIEGLTRELDGARSLTDSLRAQQHEFSNRMHALAGLLELDRPDEALQYLTELRGLSADLDQTLRTRIRSPHIVGLLLGKSAEASERGIELVIDPDTAIGEAPDRLRVLTTVIGNLVDNAFDALTGAPAPRRVTVSAIESPEEIVVTVSDNGPGVPPGEIAHIFHDGYTTKRGSLVRHSGLGLALVHDAVSKVGGTVTVTNEEGAVFRVVIPRDGAAAATTAGGGEAP
ncbi:sensor histidine kinase [Microbacterium sp. ASV49]|uniref:histidine kinase n=1 Tax=Microbacterium candidum TaxID=3041922 RepID=A0ABT7N1H9_9MICO|nr:sensor histidine kinase [Microbacterium sp. ASV49]MDL9980557.1 sensor histidine kinase [Microbacterium sp. ASV49]